jgi:hypothetical protein
MNPVTTYLGESGGTTFRIWQSPPRNDRMNQNFRNFALWAVILLLLVALFNLFQNPAGQSALPRSLTRSSAATPLTDACRAW